MSEDPTAPSPRAAAPAPAAPAAYLTIETLAEFGDYVLHTADLNTAGHVAAFIEYIRGNIKKDSSERAAAFLLKFPASQPPKMLEKVVGHLADASNESDATLHMFAKVAGDNKNIVIAWAKTEEPLKRLFNVGSYKKVRALRR